MLSGLFLLNTGRITLRALGDNLDVTAVVDEIPLAKDAGGVYRVGGTRVTLDLVVRAFNRGATAEEIVQKYDNLRLPDVYPACEEHELCPAIDPAQPRHRQTSPGNL